MGSTLTPTFVTSDFNVYFFDRGEYPGINKETVENVVEHTRRVGKSAYISAANSLGFMDGGSDLGYMNSLDDIQTRVKTGIKILDIKSDIERPYLGIGNAMGFWYDQLCYFVSAPTMLSPQKIIGTNNPYNALRSALVLCKSQKIENVYVCMMGTGYGGLSFQSAFNLMAKAVNDYHMSDVNLIMYSGYHYALHDLSTYNKILLEQPKVYANREFGVEYD